MTSIIIITILLAVSIVTQLKLYLEVVSTGALNVSLLFPIVVNSIPQYASVVLPLAVFIALIVTISRLHNSNELIIFNVCGINRHALGRMLIPFCLVYFILACFLNLYVVPYSAQKIEEALFTQKNLDVFDLITPKKFIPLNDEIDLYVDSLSADKTTLQDVYVFSNSPHNTGRSDVVYAERAILMRKDTLRYIKLIDGYQVSVVPGRADLTRTTFDDMSIKLPEQTKVIHVSRKETMSSRDLLASDDPDMYQFFFWRVSLALLVPILSILAIYLFTARARSDGTALNFMLYMSASVVYIGLLITASSLSSKGNIAPEISYGLVHTLAIVFAFSFYKWRQLKSG